MKKFTFDIIHRDSFPKQILIRFANDSDSEGDVFPTLEACQESVNTSMSMDIYISKEVIDNVDPIKYNDTIKKELFVEFVSLLKEKDPTEYENEAKDKFVDLYNYWTERGGQRFAQQMLKLYQK